MVFPDRETAARLLAQRLIHCRGQNPLVLAIPRGAVPMGRVIAGALGGELDVVLVRKLRHPHSPEFAIGAVSETGEVTLSEHAREEGIPADYVDAEARLQLSKLAERRRAYTPGRPPAKIEGRVVIVLDDGVATGETMAAALRLVRARRPQRLVAATAVAPPETVRRLERLADEVVCLSTPQDFRAVGQFFVDFSEVSDQEVAALLQSQHSAVAAPSAAP